MQTLASVISFAVSLYSLLIIVRILLSWVSLGEESSFHEVYGFLERVTEPFLKFFRRIPGLQRAGFDFSPVAALVTLGIISSIFNTLAQQGRISVGIVLAIILQALWSIFAFFLLIFIILLIIRLVMDYSQSPGAARYAPILDMLVKHPVNAAHKLFFRGQPISIRKGLFGGLLLTIGIRFFGTILIDWILRLLYSLPF